MMDDEFGLTQDCVEWVDENAGDLRNQLNHTPAQHGTKKDYSPNQEIDELWKLLGTPSHQVSQVLQRSNSVPLPRRQHRTRRHKPGDRKRKRPSSADSCNHEGNQRPDVSEQSHANSNSFEELLRQLDTPLNVPTTNREGTPFRSPVPMNNPKPMESNNIMPSAHSTKIMPPPKLGMPATQSLPSFVPKHANLGVNQVSIQNETEAEESTYFRPWPSVHDAATSTFRLKTRDLPLKSLQTSDSGNEIESMPRFTPTSHAEFDDDFDLSDGDLAALDAVVLSQTKIKNSIPLQATMALSRPCKVPTEHVVQDHVASQPQVCGDDEFEDFNIDFDELDGQIEQKLKKATSKPPRESFGDPFGDTFDFSELDKSIAARKSDCSSTPLEPLFRVDVASLQIPPFDAKVWNPRVLGHDIDHSANTFSRYRVVSVVDENSCYTKAVLVKSWRNEMFDSDTIKTIAHRPSSSSKRRTQNVKETVGDGWIFLRGEWYHSPVQSGDAINLCSLSGRYETNVDALPVVLHTNAPAESDEHDDLFLVLHPDTLVPPTMVSETVSCSRRAVLRLRLGSTGTSSSAALYGTMRHLLFEKCMRNQDFSINFARESVHAIVRETAENLVALGIKEGDAQKEVIRILPQLQQFRNDFMDRNRSLDKASKLDGNGVNSDQKFIALSVEGTEEVLVSPEYGLKGNVDVTVKAKTQDIPSHFIPNQTDPETGLVGIELKTGHNQTPQNTHMAQLALYTLMLTLQYGRSSLEQNASRSGMLLYLNPEGIRAFRVSPLIQELKSLVGQRNVLACEVRKVSAPRGVRIVYEDKNEADHNDHYTIEPAPPACLPDVLSGPQPCNRCYSNRECMLYAAAAISTQAQGRSTVKESHAKLLAHFCGHLDDDDLRYFNDWDRLIDLEADATARPVSNSWLTPSLELELSTGKSVSSLVLDEHFLPRGHNNGSEWVSIPLHRSPDAASTSSFSTLHMEPGSLVVLSVDATLLDSSSEMKRKTNARVRRHTMHIARGMIDSLEESRIVLKVSSQESRQLVREVLSARARRETLLLRLDRDDVQTGLGTTRQNLINLFSGDTQPFENSKADPKLSQNLLIRNRYAWLRNAVVKLHPPQYDLGRSYLMFNKAPGVSIPGCDLACLQRDFERLNDDQRNAAKKVFSAKDYSLIQGLPGTGKSATIAFVARLLVAHGKRVLITSYTHSAVDNLMMKLIDHGLSSTSKTDTGPIMIRLGKKETCHPAVHPILLSAAALTLQHKIEATLEPKIEKTSSVPSCDALHQVLSGARIVGVTALSIPRSPLLVGQEFDVVIVDEAGQISQPVIIGALMAADAFVLVGDHKQLPPLVTSDVADKAGFGVSMLSRLADKHSDCVAQLTLQYRMHEDICRICNEIVYEGKLKCANEDVKSRVLTLSWFKVSDDWVSRIIDPSRPVVFADTDFFDRDFNQIATNQIVALERRPEKSGNMVNDREVAIVGRIIDALIGSGLPASSIGVISPFRAQVRQLNESAAISKWKMGGLEVSTIDRFQGRDKQVIIISLVRSNSNGYSGRLLNDFRRLNVAVSRAMCKLVLVGSYKTLHCGSDVLRPVLDGFTARKQIEKIPEHVLRSLIT
jgi:DNA replication ATP-dependent helicase Dna2